jgi:aerobic carbon-monoxide dehydrogenase medium subunit
MKSAPFAYHSPSDIDEAAALLNELGDEAKLLAGGQSLIPMLALRLARFDHLIDVGRISELRGIERRDGSLWIGAGTTEAVVGSNPDVLTAVPLLSRATPLIGHFQIRNRGTIGGSIAHADPAAEYPALALALDAELDVQSGAGRRTLLASEFFTGLWSTEVQSDEILTGVRFPIWTGRCGFAIEEIARRHGDFAIAGAAVALELDDDDDRVRRCAIGLIGVGSTPERGRTAENEVLGRNLSEIDPAEVGRLAMSELDSIPSDLHGSSEYRKRVGAVMTARAWLSAAEEARHA